MPKRKIPYWSGEVSSSSGSSTTYLSRTGVVVVTHPGSTLTLTLTLTPTVSGEVTRPAALSRATAVHTFANAHFPNVLLGFSPAFEKSVPRPHAQDYDTIYILNLTASGALASFDVQAQPHTP